MKSKPLPEALWTDGVPPTLSNLQGKFTVKILSGPFYPLNWIYSSWEKYILGHSGHNIVSGRTCGHFIISPNHDNSHLIYSAVKTNSNTWKRLEDWVKLITHEDEEATIIGQIYTNLLWKKRFMGYFTLTPIKHEEPK